MRKLLISAILALPLFAGALILQVDDPRSNPEAIAKSAVVVAHITACHSPEKTTVTAVAEGLVNGQRQSIPLKVVNLSQPGAFAIARQWPQQGTWTVKMTATNPDYPNYANTITVPLKSDTLN
jgi:hypothetical protein